MTNIEKTIKFLKETFDNSEIAQQYKDETEYRLNHTIRVTKIGKQIALKENLDVEGVVIGCLLHDISYSLDFKTKEEHRAHGRTSEKMARDFVNSLDLKQEAKEQLLYGIAIHVDGKSDYEYPNNPLSSTISDCDNIDRFDAYRLYESLLYSNLNKMKLQDQIQTVSQKLTRLNELKNYKLATNEANKLWNEKLDYQIEYFQKLYDQLLLSNPGDL